TNRVNCPIGIAIVAFPHLNDRGPTKTLERLGLDRVSLAHLGKIEREAHVALNGGRKGHEVGLRTSTPMSGFGSAPDRNMSVLCESSHQRSSASAPTRATVTVCKL